MRSVGTLVLPALTAVVFLACTGGGSGVGTAPKPSPDCPTDPPSALAGTPCGAKFPEGKVCCCTEASCDAPDSIADAATCPKVALCKGGSAATWEVQDPSTADATPLNDALADAPETTPDADASDADASDAIDGDGDATDANDAVEETDATDSADVSDAALDAADADGD